VEFNIINKIKIIDIKIIEIVFITKKIIGLIDKFLKCTFMEDE
jgi:hypothetical protein